MAIDYLVQEEDGTSKFTKEESDGFIILEESTVVPPAGGNIFMPTFRPRRRQ